MKFKTFITVAIVSPMLLTGCTIINEPSDSSESAPVDHSNDGLYLTYKADGYEPKAENKLTTSGDESYIDVHLNHGDKIRIIKVDGDVTTLYPYAERSKINYPYLTNCNSALDECYIFEELDRNSYKNKHDGYLNAVRSGDYHISFSQNGIMVSTVKVDDLYIEFNGQRFIGNRYSNYEDRFLSYEFPVFQNNGYYEYPYPSLPADSTFTVKCESEEVTLHPLTWDDPIKPSIDGNTFKLDNEVKNVWVVQVVVDWQSGKYMARILQEGYNIKVDGVTPSQGRREYNELQGGYCVRLEPGQTFTVVKGEDDVTPMNLYRDSDGQDLIGTSITNETLDVKKYYYNHFWNDDDDTIIKVWEADDEKFVTVDLSHVETSYPLSDFFVRSWINGHYYVGATSFVKDGKVLILKDANYYEVGVYKDVPGTMRDPLNVTWNDLAFTKIKSNMVSTVPEEKINVYFNSSYFYVNNDDDPAPTTRNITLLAGTSNYFDDSNSVYVWYWGGPFQGGWSKVTFTPGASSGTFEVSSLATGFLVAKFNHVENEPDWTEFNHGPSSKTADKQLDSIIDEYTIDNTTPYGS